MRWTIKLPAANAVAAGNTSTFRIPVGNRLHWLYLAFSNANVSDMTELRVKFNATVVQRYSGTNLNLFNQFRGLSDAGTTGVMEIPFDRVNLLNRQVEEMTAINTNSADQNGRAITSVTLEVDLASSAGTPANSTTGTPYIPPTLDLHGEVSDQVPGGPGSIIWMLPENVTINSAGDLQEHAVTPVGGPTRQLLNAAFFVNSNIGRVQVQRDNLDLFDRPTNLNNVIQQDGKRAPQSGLYVMDPSERGYGGNMIDLTGTQDFRYRVNYSAAGDYLLYNEFIGRAP